MKIQNIYKNTIRHRKNNRWLQRTEQSEKPENHTKLKILKISRICHNPSLLQRLERFFKVTPCNEKCNFFILLQNIQLLRILLIGIIPLCRDRTSLLVQLRHLLFCGRDSDPRSLYHKLLVCEHTTFPPPNPSYPRNPRNPCNLRFRQSRTPIPDLIPSKTKYTSILYLSYITVNMCDSRKMGIHEIINPYRIRARKNAP